VVALVAVLVRAVWFTPVEAMQGAAQKIFYVHVPSAFVGLYLGLPLVAIASGVYLWLKDDRLDRTAEAAAEVSLVFMTVVLITGPAVGEADLGHLVDVGRAAHAHPVPLVRGGGLPRAARRRRRPRPARPLLGGARRAHGAARAVHPPERVPVPHAAPAADRAQAERAVAAGEMRTTLFLALGAFALLFVALLRARVRYGHERDLLVLREAGEGMA
jgi:heme exporter protein C